MHEYELNVNEKIISQTAATDEIIIADGAIATIYYFEASTPDAPLAATRLVWDYGGANEENLWIIQRHGKMPEGIKTLTVTGDGQKKLALVCQNDCNNDYFFHGFVKLKTKQ